MRSFQPTKNDILELDTMGNPIDKLKKIKGRSWDELRTRGGQVFSVYSEQIGLSGKMPTDAEFAQLIDKSFFGKSPIIAEGLWVKFFKNGDTRFFPSFGRQKETVEAFRNLFSDKQERWFIEKASKIVDGRFDLLGYQNLDLGKEIDWHLEPVSGKRSPMKHWKQFDELDTSETGDKKLIWELNRHQHFFTLGVAFWLTKDERYAAVFAKHLASWMEQNPPGTGINWFSSMEIAFRSMSWIWAFHFFRDSDHFTPDLFHKALKFLYLQGRHIEKYLSTYYSPNTHLTGEALGLYYLGTQLPFIERSGQWRKLGEDILLAELDRQIHPDGVYFEQSTWYQKYTVDFYTQFLILKTLQGGEMEKKSSEKLEFKLQAALDFLMYITRPDGTTPIIGDDDGGKALPFGKKRSDNFRASLVTGAALFERGDYKYIGGDPAPETLWLLGLEGVQAYKTLRAHVPHNTSQKFPLGGYFAMRDGWSETDNYLLVDCGEVGALAGGHGHADTLAIELAIHGKTVLVDSGTYTYHESRELRNYFRSTTAHNTLVIDKISSSEPGDKFSWKTKAEAKIDSLICQDRFDFFEGSHNGYERIANAPATHRRSILFLKNDYWIMRDVVDARLDHDYALNFHLKTGMKPVIEGTESGGFYVGEEPSNEDGWRFFTFGDNGGWQRKESWSSTNYGEKVNSPFLRYVSKGKGTQEFFTFMLPVEVGCEKPEVSETPVPGGRAFVVSYRGYKDLVVFADSTDQIVRTEIFNTNFQVFWARLSEGETLPEEFVMVGGTHFTLGGREIINHPNEVEFASARRFGNKLNVRTSESIFSISIPQKRRSTTYILKNPEEV
jgi:hypothetical protein